MLNFYLKFKDALLNNSGVFGNSCSPAVLSPCIRPCWPPRSPVGHKVSHSNSSTPIYVAAARWLDDVGLPQYKDSFLEARVDGRVLNFLTVEDLFSLKVEHL